MSNPLDISKRPIQFGFEVSPEINISIARARNELACNAENNVDGRCDYIHGINIINPKIKLPASERFEELMPEICIDDLRLGFNSLALSLKSNENNNSWFINRNVEVDQPKWQALINLNVLNNRNFEFLDVDPSTVPLEESPNWATLDNNNYDQFSKKIILPKRSGLMLCGVLFKSNQVICRLPEVQSGYFSAGYTV